MLTILRGIGLTILALQALGLLLFGLALLHAAIENHRDTIARFWQLMNNDPQADLRELADSFSRMAAQNQDAVERQQQLLSLNDDQVRRTR